ncbi:MAG: hypothetical protein A2X86_00710 [Bdellovibrionales bacterium GWA2_49_15]|nr:MAG: hypothetical protein A2X86_00710 [Bdellovibrionales bacterium GWA2_49_15]HAZ14618.1 response regulator [Bdellovibrionales bacterium]
MNILIADDSLLSRSYVKKVLTMVGLSEAKIFEVGNGKDALPVLESHSINCLFLDINMPIMTGTELIDAMAEKGLGTKTHVIITSSVVDEARITQLKAKGVRFFLKKPFTPEGLKNITDLLTGAL